MIDETITELTELVGTKAACRAGTVSGHHYRRHRQSRHRRVSASSLPGSLGP